MEKITGIEWTGSTWNPWRGCRKVSEGCKSCYMYRQQRRYGKEPAIVVRAVNGTFRQPLKWKEPRRIFTCSWSDWFITEADAWRDEAWEIIRKTPGHTYQILTKRPENIESRLPADWGAGYPNTWLGVSVENQEQLARAEMLARIPARLRFISYEPALGPVDFSPVLPAFGWLISGGESGVGCRPADPTWFAAVQDQCSHAGVAFFHKQNGGRTKIAGSYGGHLLDGQEYRAFPILEGE